jgi:methanogenic corrinoid protein MtbC1
MADLGQRPGEDDPSVNEMIVRETGSTAHAVTDTDVNKTNTLPNGQADPKGAAAEDLMSEQRCKLARTIEGEVIPRLMLAHGAVPNRCARPSAKPDDTLPSPDDSVELARLVVSRDLPEALAFIDGLRDRGIGTESIFLHVFAPAARLLGKFWEADRCSFAEVTIGLSRLQQLMRELSPALDQAFGQPDDAHKILLVPAPGEQHTFGLSMLGILCRQAGFAVYDGELLHAEDVPALVRHERFAAIGFTASTNDKLDALTDLIRRVRRSVHTGDPHVMVGGACFNENPERVVEVGADAMAVDGRQAVLHMQALLKRDPAPSSGPPRSRGAARGNVHTVPWAGEPLQDSRNVAARY